MNEENTSTENTEEKVKYDSTKITQTGLWKKVGKNSGLGYLSGRLQNYWVNIFSNKDANKLESDPDAHLKLQPTNKRFEMTEADGSKVFEFKDGTIVNLYKRTSKKGVSYLRGIRDDLQYHLYVMEKKSPKHPDYNLVIYERSTDREYSRETTPQKQQLLNQGMPPEEKEDAFEDPLEGINL